MDGLLILLAIAFVGLVSLGIPVALLRQGSLQRQIRDLQKDLGVLAQELRDLKREGLRPAKTPATGPESEPEASQTTTFEPVTASATPARAQPAARASVKDKAARSSVPPVARRLVPAAPTEPKAFVFTEGKMEALTDWLKVNWVLAIAAASLGFAGIFMVQYGIEHGVLSPFWRVMAAFGFGGVLVAAGEYTRRRYGDEGEDAMRHVPSVLSGAGVITLFAGVLSARLM